jgi:hypothetical protein
LHACAHCSLCYTGQLGIGSTVRIGYSETPGNSTTVNFGTDAVVTAVSIGTGISGFVCAIVNGTVKCWGAGESGALGQGNIDNLSNTTATIPANIIPVK